MAIRQLQSSLASHTDAQQSDSRRANLPLRFNERNNRLSEPLHRSDVEIKVRANTIHPPGPPTIRAHGGQVVVLKQLRKHPILSQSNTSVTVKKQYTAGRFLTDRTEDTHTSRIHFDNGPAGNDVRPLSPRRFEEFSKGSKHESRSKRKWKTTAGCRLGSLIASSPPTPVFRAFRGRFFAFHRFRN